LPEPLVFVRRAAVAASVLLVLPAWAAAQEPPPADSCDTGLITALFLDNQSIFDTTDPDLDRRFRWAYGAANALHFQTKERVIRRELLFGVGDCYDPFMLEETERLLRGYDFIGRVDVRGERQPDGTYYAFVETQDEWSTRLDMRVRFDNGFEIEGAAINEENLLGTGQTLGLFYIARDVTRDYGLSYFTPQLAGTRWDLMTAFGQSRAGTFVREQVVYPFVGEVSRWAGRQSFSREDQFFDYTAGDDPELRADHVLLPTREKFFDMAVMRRVGRRGNSALVGAGISFQELDYPGPVQVAPDGDFDGRTPADSAVEALVLQQRERLSSIRLSALVGYRSVWWTERRGLDNLRGEQDVRLGAEVGLALGRSIPSLEQDDDTNITLTIYTAVAAGPALFAARSRADVRRDLAAPAGADEWEDLYGEGELFAYFKPRPDSRHTLLFRAAAAGAWNTRTPFQLTLGGERALRGYDIERYPGGRRLVLTLEERFYLGWPFRDVFDNGITLFADAGRIWPGDAPFGGDSGWRASAGLGLRQNFPAGSRTTYRLDVAWPFEAGTGFGDFRLLLSIGESVGLSATQGDLQLLRSRPEGVAGQLFQFRN
jgi:hypothetical protein